MLILPHLIAFHPNGLSFGVENDSAQRLIFIPFVGFFPDVFDCFDKNMLALRGSAVLGRVANQCPKVEWLWESSGYSFGGENTLRGKIHGVDEVRAGW
jgi:hypothetical protein